MKGRDRPLNAATGHTQSAPNAGSERTDRQLLEQFALHGDEQPSPFASAARTDGPDTPVGGSSQIDQMSRMRFRPRFLILAKKAGSVRWSDSIAGWLYLVAGRVAMRARKKPNHGSSASGKQERSLPCARTAIPMSNWPR